MKAAEFAEKIDSTLTEKIDTILGNKPGPDRD